MNGDSEAIDLALAELASSVAMQLHGDGWVRRDIDPRRYVLVMTKPVRDDVMATVEVRVTGLRWPRRWPETVDVGFGAGFEPALNLMPLVTLSPQATLVSESDVLGEPDLTVEVASASQAATVATRLATAIRDHGVGFAERYDVDTLDVALAEQPALRLVLLASAGRVEQARSALARYVAGGGGGDDDGGGDDGQGRGGDDGRDDGGDDDRGRDDEGDDDGDRDDDRRFVRQLTRWLDAGRTAIPPLEQTLRRLPPPPPKSSWSRARQDSRERSAARDAVRAAARGKTREQIRDLLAAEYAVRGLDIAPSALAYGADMIELEQRPFGKLRGLARGLQLLRSAGSAAAATAGDRPGNDPEWMRPSPRASYVVDTRRPFVAITLNPAAAGVLGRAVAEASRRVGPAVLIDVWLDGGGADQNVHVHLGEHDVGTLPDEAARRFAVDLSAASELFDEVVRVRAMLTPGATGRSASLEIGTPKHAA